MVPGGSGHVDGDSPDGLAQEAILVAGGHLLARGNAAFSDARYEGLKGLFVHLRFLRGGRRVDKEGDCHSAHPIWLRLVLAKIRSISSQPKT